MPWSRRWTPELGGILDTNVLLYAANSDAPENAAASALLERAASSNEAWYLTEGICYEFLRVATHPAVFPRPLTALEAISFLDALLAQEHFRVLAAGEGHWSLLHDILGELHEPAGNLFFDVRTATLMREHGVRKVYTADRDFDRFRGIEVIDPLT